MNTIRFNLFREPAIAIAVILVAFQSQETMASKPWSGQIVYKVESLNAEASAWDYLPQTITYETNGEAWKIIEQGTSFERIWLGNFEDEDYYILFHFLGHAIELLESCPSIDESAAGKLFDSPAPCPWSLPALPESCVLSDGPASFQITAIQKLDIPAKNWERKSFQLPKGYEPMDRMSLAALLTRISSSSY